MVSVYTVTIEESLNSSVKRRTITNWFKYQRSKLSGSVADNNRYVIAI